LVDGQRRLPFAGDVSMADPGIIRIDEDQVSQFILLGKEGTKTLTGKILL